MSKYRSILRMILLAAFVPLAGCAALEPLVGVYGGEHGLALLEKASQGAEKVEDATLGNAMKALPKYCKVPPASRKLFRERINARPEAEGAQILVICPGDA